MWIDLIGKEFNDRELYNIAQTFNADGFYCKRKNPHEYEIGLEREPTHYLMTLSRDRVITIGHNLKTYCSPSEVSLVAHKLELVRPTGLEDVINDVNSANKSRPSPEPYVSN